MDRALIPRRALAGVAGLLAGVAAGTVVAVVAGAAVAHRSATGALEAQIEATHLPPLLTAPGEQVELRYDIYCLGGEDDAEGPACDADGTVFVRAGDSGFFREVPLSLDAAASEGRYVARLPQEMVGSPAGFSYYAVLRSPTSGASLKLPAGGAAAPQRSLPLERSVDVRLGAHRFGATRGADGRVAEASWGDGPDNVGLEQGRTLTPIGGSTFDVDRGGTVYVLDEANRRLLHWPSGVRTPTSIPLSISGTLADLAVGENGTIYVLETTTSDGRGPFLRSFHADGSSAGASQVAERASQVRIGPNGPVVLQHPSGDLHNSSIRAILNMERPADRPPGVHGGYDMKAIAYMRRSQDSGTGVSEEIQDEAIREYVERKGGTVAYWLPPDLDASSWTLDRPSMQKALGLLAQGKADTLVVAKLSRVTRRRADWERLLELMREQGWTIRSADFDVDLSDKGGRLIAGILIDFLGFEYEEKRDAYDDARRNAVLVHGVHGGDKAPLGYRWTKRPDRHGRLTLRGPLEPDPAAAKRVVAAFDACASDDPRERAWSNVLRVLGAKSQGAASVIIRNRVYLGEARSGEFVKPEAHEALVDDALFRRANRKRSGRSVSYKGRTGALLGGRILRCATCGYALMRDSSKRGEHYRCKKVTCTARASIQAATVEPYVLLQALAWHATLNPMHISDLDAAAVPVFEEELAKAQAQEAEVERLHQAGELDPVAYGKALTAARWAVAAAETALAEVEASRGWLGMTTEAVQRRLFGTAEQTDTLPDPAKLRSVEEGRDFVKQMVRVTVRPVGRGRKVPVQDRVEVEMLTPAAALQDEALVQFEVAS